MPSTKSLVTAAMVMVFSAQAQTTPSLGCGQLVAMNCGFCSPDLPKPEAKECYNSVKGCVLGWMNFPLSVAGCKPFAKRIPKNAPVDMECYSTLQASCGNCFLPTLDEASHKACVDGCKKMFKSTFKQQGCLSKKKERRNLEDDDGYDDDDEEEMGDFDFDDDEEVEEDDDEDVRRRSLAYRPLNCAKDLREACPECKKLQFGSGERDDCAMDCYEANPSAFPSCTDRFECKIALRDNCDCDDDEDDFDLAGRRECQKACVEENPDAFEGLGCFPTKEDRERQREECKAYIEELCQPCEDEPKLFAKFKCLRDCAKAAADDDDNPCTNRAFNGFVY